MKVLFATSEMYPYAKTGGLADVADALPKSLQQYTDISRVMPLYGFLSKENLKVFKTIELDLGGINYSVTVYLSSKNKIKTYFIEAPLLSTTDHLYGENGSDYASNDIRFGIFSKAIVQLCDILDIDILHLNDWHTALAALFVKEKNLSTKVVFTIHNLAYQGVFPYGSMQRLGLDAKYFSIDALEYYGQINFMKAAIAFSDFVTTVSPTYAQEILTPEFGCGLEGFLEVHNQKIRGILNGINTDVFHFNLEKKHPSKVAFFKNSKLKDPRKPLFVVLSRLVEQKGFDLFLEVLPKVLEQKINIFVLGEGESKEINKLTRYAQKFPNLEFKNCYDENLSHEAYSAADFLLMPSRFEPCGLSQMIAMTYGAIPIVHAIGGLKDSVFEDEKKCGYGIVFDKFTKKDFLSAIDRAMTLRKDSKKFNEIRQSNMQCDFSFEKSAKIYYELYKSLI